MPRDKITLTLIASHRFMGGTRFFGDTRFERDESGALMGRRVTSGRVRSLLFVKRTGSEVRR